MRSTDPITGYVQDDDLPIPARTSTAPVKRDQYGTIIPPAGTPEYSAWHAANLQRQVDDGSAPTSVIQAVAQNNKTVAPDVNAARDTAIQAFETKTAPPAAPSNPTAALTAAAASGAFAGAQPNQLVGAFEAGGVPRATSSRAAYDPQLRGIGAAGGAVAPEADAAANNAPTVDRSRIDALLRGVNSANSGLLQLAANDDQLSVAEAQLMKSDRQASIRQAIATDQSQRSALGAARSSRNRGDQGLLSRQAVGESAYIGQEAARTEAMRQAGVEGDLAILRATEEDQNKRFKADVLGKAAELGLNTAAFELDTEKTDIASATNWINNEFARNNLKLELNEKQAESVLQYTQAQAALEYEYANLSSEEQRALDANLMQKYGIDKQTEVALKQIKEGGKVHWGQVLAGMAQGVVTGAAGAATTLAGKK